MGRDLQWWLLGRRNSRCTAPLLQVQCVGATLWGETYVSSMITFGKSRPIGTLQPSALCC